MTRIQFVVVILSWLAFRGLSASAQVLEPEALQRKQEDQQRAKAMTRELLHNVLDLQLRQLEENDLTDLEIYRDIQLMREHLNEVVEAEMTKVVDLLVKAQKLPKEQREAVFVEARQMIRTVVLALSAERQNLLRRLKIAELAEQVRRLIALETKVQAATKLLPTESKARQEALTLKTVEDQRDVKGLFLLLVETMNEVRTWGGALSNAAADGLKLLKVADVGKELDEASRTLQSTEFTAAVAHQESVIKGLRELLKLLQRTQGVMGAENQSAVNQVQELAKQQAALREETKKLDAAEKAPEALVEQQAKVQQELAKLQDAVQQTPAAEAHLEQAKAAAVEATADLFENQSAQAVAEQTKVLGHLAALEEAMKDASPKSNADRSAAELAQMVKDLQQTKQQLADAQQKQNAAEKQAETNAQAAAQPEAQAAAAIEQAMKNENLPDSIANRLDEAQTAAALAAKELAQAAAEPAKKAQQAALANAEDALERAMAAVDAALSDAQRQQAAVEIGELARAAEVLERAAAEERDIAQAAKAAAKESDPKAAAEKAHAAAQRQAMVEAVADKIAEGLQQTSPESAQDVASGKEAAKQSEQALDQAAAKAAESPQQAKEQAQQAAKQANAAAEKFAEAAQQLREEIAQTASDLANTSEKQADRLKDARAKVEKGLEIAGPTPAQQMEKLFQAQAKVAEAMKQQQMAIGRPEAAKAMDLADRIAAALQAQNQATEIAAAAARSDAISPLQAAVEQQNAAEKAQQAAGPAEDRPQAAEAKAAGQADPLAQALENAQKSAAEATKKLADGNKPAAQAQQENAKNALKSALEMALTEAKQALAKAPEGKPDAAAQEKANQAVEAAQQLAAKEAPQAGEALGDAAESGEQAKQKLAEQQPAAAVPAQEKAAKALNAAEQKIAEAMNKLNADQARQLEEQALFAEQLADEAAGLDLGTMEALAAAKDAAEEGALPDTSSQQRAKSSDRAARNMERAAANLATKEQDIRRDQAVADALAELAEEQQAAADVLAEQRDEEKFEPSAADAIATATEKFAEVQQALGQGAVELSNQVEVANKPLREALELASEFPSLQADDLHQMPKDAAHGEMPDEPAPVAEADQGDGQPMDDTPLAEGEAATVPDAKSKELGTSFVPKSPEVTAKMMAGPEARAAMKAARLNPHDGQNKKATGKKDSKNSALAQKLAKSKQGDQPADPNDEPQDADAQSISELKQSKNTSQTDNTAVKDGPTHKQEEGTKAADSRGEKSKGSEETQALRKFREAPWFAKLPPELRKSIRANAQQRAPRAYEDKLRKYFESVD